MILKNNIGEERNSQDRKTILKNIDDPVGEKPDTAKRNTEEVKKDEKFLVFLIIGILGIIGGVGCILFGCFGFKNTVNEVIFLQINQNEIDVVGYSALTGDALMDGASVNAPAYCIQTPNGMDGARPQAGLNEAGVIFEAIAEAGITRFAAIYQNPSSAVIGPIRSLRIYYLEWDTPFDCTIVHAGGAYDALMAVRSGGYRDLSEDYAYMYRGTYGGRLWNNLFTTASYLKQFSEDYSYNESNINGFSRMTPEESERARIDASAVEKLNIIKSTDSDVSELTVEVSNVAINFGGFASFNVRYAYDVDTNTYYRSYESGDAHEVYACDAVDLGEKNPENVCTLTQMNPAVVVAMVVQEGKASDNYHEDIVTIGTGDAYIFQNGTVIEGSWSKSAINEQIKFFDEEGKEVALAPGQTFVSAVPAYGSIEY